jgi:hypothetical protein
MATSLKLVFDGSGGKKISFTFPYASLSASGAQVKVLMESMVANGDIYAEVPTGRAKADFVVNEVTSIDID